MTAKSPHAKLKNRIISICKGKVTGTVDDRFSKIIRVMMSKDPYWARYEEPHSDGKEYRGFRAWQEIMCVIDSVLKESPDKENTND